MYIHKQSIEDIKWTSIKLNFKVRRDVQWTSNGLLIFWVHEPSTGHTLNVQWILLSGHPSCLLDNWFVSTNCPLDIQGIIRFLRLWFCLSMITVWNSIFKSI